MLFRSAESICLPFVHVGPTKEVAPAFSDGGPFVNSLDKADRDGGCSVSSCDWKFTVVSIHVWEKGTRRKVDIKVHSFALCCKCFCHVAHIVVIRRGGAADDLSQCTNIML